MTIRTHICPFAPGIKDECPRYFLVQFQLKLLYTYIYSSQIKPPTWHFQRVLRSAARSWQMSMSGALHFSFPTSWGTVGFEVDAWVGWLIGVRSPMRENWLRTNRNVWELSNKENINPFNTMKFLSEKHTWLHNSLWSHRHIYMIHFVAFPFLTSKRTYQQNSTKTCSIKGPHYPPIPREKTDTNVKTWSNSVLPRNVQISSRSDSDAPLIWTHLR